MSGGFENKKDSGLELTAEELLLIQTAETGVYLMKETTAPSETSGYGKLYVKSSDSLLYFKDDSGNEYSITSPGSGTWGSITGILSNQTDLQNALNAKQDTLISGTTIKTINGSSILASGDLTLLTSLSGALLATGATTGATSQAQAFTNGVITGKLYPSVDSTTAIQLLKADGTTSVLNVDTTNGRVGIGTTSPSELLQVQGGNIRMSSNNTYGGTQGSIKFSSNGYAYGYSGITGVGNVAGLDQMDLAFYTSNGASTEKMRILNTGNVGIGTASPNAKLSFGTGVVDNKIYLYDGTNDKYGFGIRSSQFMIYSGAGGGSTGGITFGKFDGTTFTESMRIQNGGNVGIGTTGPGTPLHIARSSASAVLNAFNIQNSAGPVAGGVQGVKFNFLGDSGYTATNPTAYIESMSNDGGSNGEGSLRLGVNTGTGGIQEKVRITSLGNVGIGTTTPGAKLDVYKSSGWVSSAVDSGGQFMGMAADSSFNPSIFWSNTNSLRFATVSGKDAAGWSEKMRISSTGGLSLGSDYVATDPGAGSMIIQGNVGIGTNAPTAVLHLKAGTATANTAPLKFTSGVLNTVPAAGAMEFLTDALYFTITTGAVRKTIAFTDTAPAAHAASHAVGGADTVFPADPNADKFLKWNDTSGALEWADGTSGTPTAITVANEASDTTCFPLFVTAATGDLGPKTNAGLTFNSNTGVLAATGFSGPLTGDVTGNVSGSSGSTTGNAATATILATARAIYGNNFDGSAALTQIIASTYGGTGNGFTKFSGPTTAEKTFTLPDANATLLYSGGALGTPSGGTLTNCTGLPVAGITASTSTALGVGSLEIGHASDTTLARSAAGVLQVEGKTLVNLTDGGTFAADISVPDEAYGAGWDGSMEVPTKNAVYDKIQTLGSPTYKNGLTTYDISTASGTQNIAHGLGAVPKHVRIDASLPIGSTGFSGSVSVYNGTTQSSWAWMEDASNGRSNASVFRLSSDAGAYASGVITVDATNIIITWTKTGSAAGTAKLLWEVQ